MTSIELAQLAYRVAAPADAAACLILRGRTRQNAVSAERLASIGITALSLSDDIRSGALSGYVCTDADRIVGFCFGERATGEVVVLALLPEYEDRGIGRNLLSKVVADFRSQGFNRLCLGCSPDPSTRSYGFYRHLGWTSTRRFNAAGDEVLEYFVAR